MVVPFRDLSKHRDTSDISTSTTIYMFIYVATAHKLGIF